MDNPTPENHLTEFNNFNDWEHIRMQSASSSASDDHLTIFPPSLHQDLNIVDPLPASTIPHSDSDSTSPTSSISSPTPDPEPKAWILSLIFRRLGVRLLAMKLKVANLASKLYSFVNFWKAGIGLVLFLTVFWVIPRRWRRRRVAEEDAGKLRKLVKEKDRVIDKLLLQIAQMNEELLGRRSVPVYRVR